MADLAVRLLEVLLIELAVFSIAVLLRPRLLDEISWPTDLLSRPSAAPRYVRQGGDDENERVAEPPADGVGPRLLAAVLAVKARSKVIGRAQPGHAAVGAAGPSATVVTDGDAALPAFRLPDASAADTRETAVRRVLHGERRVLDGLVADLAGGDRQQAGRWQRLLEAFFEAVLERALDAGVVYPSPAHPFWARFTPEDGHAILVALAARGFRFDGLGGWREGRTPTKRELSIAMANAGLDPVRVHDWPTPEGMADLVSDASIRGDEFLAKVAPSLDLAQMAAALGPHSTLLAELWLQWETVRPLLLAEA